MGHYDVSDSTFTLEEIEKCSLWAEESLVRSHKRKSRLSFDFVVVSHDYTKEAIKRELQRIEVDIATDKKEANNWKVIKQRAKRGEKFSREQAYNLAKGIPL